MPENIIPEAGGSDDRQSLASANQPKSHPAAITQEEYFQEYCARHDLPTSYRTATRAGKTRILDEVVEEIGIHRKSAIRRFGQSPDALRLSGRDPGRPRVYSDETRAALMIIWDVLDLPGERQLIGSLPKWLDANDRFGELALTANVMAELRNMSSATAGRIIRERRNERLVAKKRGPKARSAIQNAVDLRTWSEWGDVQPGEVQVDTVAHTGGLLVPGNILTLTITAPFSGWTAAEAIRSLHRRHVMPALDRLFKGCPFEWTTIHTDNGSEFLNQSAIEWSDHNKIHRTRGRPGKSDDQAYIENANRAFVRRIAGHFRFESDEAIDALNSVYQVEAILTNIFRATVRMVNKERNGPKVTRRYDKAQTPLDRLLAADAIQGRARTDIEQLVERVNPFELRRKRNRLFEQLWELGRYTR